MKVPVSLVRHTSLIFMCFLSLNVVNGQTGFKTFKKNPVPVVSAHSSPFRQTLLDYYSFKEEGMEIFGTTKGDWYLKYKAMFDFRCKEPFRGVGISYAGNDSRKTGYTFRLVDNQVVEDSISFLQSKYLYNNADTLRNWGLPPRSVMGIARTEHIIRHLGIEHFKFVATVFDASKYSKFIEVPEAEQANDQMVYMEIFKYPADVDIFLFDFQMNSWMYVESVTVLGDHELELYVLQKFAPRYLENSVQRSVKK